MATLSNATLKIEAYSATQVKVTIGYVLTPSNVEKLAGTVFSEKLDLMGDDGQIDQILQNLSLNTPFNVTNSTLTVPRNRVFIVSKSKLNEDSGVGAMGEELPDEIYAKITVTYAASQPTGTTPPPPATTPVITAAWK